MMNLDNRFSLMEILRASDYPIPATCGGIALCATCLVEICRGVEQLSPPVDAEIDMLETLPLPIGDYRLSCQLRSDEALDGCIFRLFAL
ncbi:2Fe-2S iron-sulfur cluster-binding protein [Mucilaginibacter sp. HD30]